MGTLAKVQFQNYLEILERSQVTDLNSLYESDHGHDLLVSIKPDESDEHPKGYIKCHRFLLSILSPVFKQQFFGPCAKFEEMSKEGNKKMLLNITIVGYAFEVVVKVMRFLYSGDKETMMSSSLMTLFELYRFGDQYDLKEVRSTSEAMVQSTSVPADRWKEDMKLVLQYDKIFSHQGLCQCVGFRCAEAVYKTWKNVRDTTSFIAKEMDSPEAKHMMKILDSCSICRSGVECRHHSISQEPKEYEELRKEVEACRNLSSSCYNNGYDSYSSEIATKYEKKLNLLARKMDIISDKIKLPTVENFKGFSCCEYHDNKSNVK